MRARLLVLAAVLAVAAIQLAREWGRAVAPRAGERESSRSAPPTLRVAPAPSPAAFGRDPFRFVVDEPAARATRAIAETVAPSPSRAPAPARVRLFGLVRRAGILRAALVVDGEVVLASPGDTVAGVLVLALDEEEGARVRGPEGLETTLALPEEP
jgi:hypothetical protein